MFALDQSRARRLVAALLPTETDCGQDRMQAWRRFIRHGRVYQDVFVEIIPAHRAALRRLRGEPAAVLEDVAQYLAVPAYWGTIGFDTEDGLLADFVAMAPIQARQELIRQVAEILQDQRNGPCELDAVAVCEKLWAGWVKASVGTGDHADLAAFGSWFVSSVVDPAWGLASLEEVLRVAGGEVDEDHEVAERLSLLAAEFPGPVAVCLGLFVAADVRYRLARSIDAVARTLTTLEKTSAAPHAREIRGRLMARGINLPAKPRGPPTK